MNNKRKKFTLGEVFKNPYLGSKIIEVLDKNTNRVGWIWVTPNDRVIVSPNLGMYVWYNEGGEDWTVETGALWLLQKRQELI